MKLKLRAPLPITILTLAFLALLTVGQLSAETAQPEEMELVCQNWLTTVVRQNGSWAGDMYPQIDQVEEIVENDLLLARVYQIAPEGFIIVPVLKEMVPVKFYSDEGRFDINQRFGFPLMVREILTKLTQVYIDNYGSLEALQPANGEVLFDRGQRSQWDRYAAAKADFSVSLADYDQVGPLLTSRWHQFDPYYNYCPPGDGDRCVVGCVATAAAQIFKYYQWPPEGEGSHSYYWDGDNSCDGSTGGATLSADFWDPYDWDNIPDDCDAGCTDDQNDALAELNYEVAVAFDMDFGACGSGTWSYTSVFSNYFRYRNLVFTSYRSSYDAGAWFSMIVNEIDQSRPMMYLIDAHAIVCDGWRVSGELNQYHMNYGWGGSYNSWYTVDNLHCAVEGCNYLNESMQRLIIPDRRAMFTSDTTIGWVPFEVNFSGGSELGAVDDWYWDFGDGDSASGQYPTHIFETPGVFDVEVQVDSGSASYTYMKQNHIIALADTIIGQDVQGPLDSTLDIAISVTNNIPLYRLQIPFEYGGNLTLKYMGMTSTGCRTDYFDDIAYINYDGNNKRFTLNFEAGSQPPLDAGTGPVIILRFQIDDGPGNETNYIEMDGYNAYLPVFYGDLATYTPALDPAAVTYFYEGCCVGTTGDANCSGGDPDISDITRLIDFLYLSHVELCCLEEADVNVSGGDPDISDITRLIDFLYLSHAPLADCP